jgi:6-pyruvoyltetrahydropterin/6-carboxytetrahydropterin synthase
MSTLVSITKRVQFFAAHFYWLDTLTPEENQATFHACSNRAGHGHNYTVEVTIDGPLDAETGMLMNLRELKDILQTTVIDPLDHKNLNVQVPFFADHVPTLENICHYIWQTVSPQVAPYTLSYLKVIENEMLYAEKTEHTVSLTRSYDFAASHRLFNPTFSDERNWEVFGICNNPNGHGHNYELQVTVSGVPHPQTGLLMDLGELDQLVDTHLLRHVDHKHLNLDVPFFDGVIPTAENIVVVFWQQLAPHVPQLAKLRLIESRNNMAEYTGG